MIFSILLLSIVGAGITLTNDIDLTSERETALTEKGITNVQVSECIKIDDYNCKAKIYQAGGINTDVDVNYKYCSKYEQEENGNGDLVETGICLNWITLKQTEIETEVLKRVQIRLEQIADVQIERESKVSDALSGEMEVVVK